MQSQRRSSEENNDPVDIKKRKLTYEQNKQDQDHDNHINSYKLYTQEPRVAQEYFYAQFHPYQLNSKDNNPELDPISIPKTQQFVEDFNNEMNECKARACSCCGVRFILKKEEEV